MRWQGIGNQESLLVQLNIMSESCPMAAEKETVYGSTIKE